MAKAWYRNFKWKKNPFFVKSNPDLVGLDKEKELLLDYLDGGNMCFIHGESGIGKTSLLRWAELNIKGTPIYLDCEGIKEDFDIDSYIKAHRSLWRGFFGSYPKNVVLLVDESQESNGELRNDIKLYWESENVKSIVFSQTEDMGNMSRALKNRIGNRQIKLGKMSKEDAFSMIEIRTKRKNPFEKEAIYFITEKSGYLPRKILENCERICISMSKRGGKRRYLSKDDAENILSKNKDEVKNSLGHQTKKGKFSPMQGKIVDLLKISGRTSQELAEILGTSEGSVGKQLSKLSNMGEVKVINDKRPKVYGLN